MHVGLNLIFLVPGETGGMEIAARELIKALAAERPDIRLTAFVNREAADIPGPWDALHGKVVVPVHASRRAEWVLGEQAMLPRLAARARVDLVHSLASTAPAGGRFRRVVTVHDLIYSKFPEAHFGLRTLGMRVLVPLAVRRAHRVIAISRSTRDDIVSLLGTPVDRIDVVPEAGKPVEETVRALDEDTVRSRHALGHRRILLSVSAKRPHKNLVRLIEALALIAPESRPVLLLPGYPTPHERELRKRAAALGVAGDVRLPAWVGEEELEGMYAAADAFVFPSLYEGFGLPVLEAMSRGLPVACSKASSLPEVAGDAALLFDPRDPRAIAKAVMRLLADRQLADRLRAAGTARAAQFSWAAAAHKTAHTYERALGGP